MPGDAQEFLSREQRLDEAVTAFLEAQEAGRRPHREEWLTRYPELAAELQQFFADQDEVNRLTVPLRTALQGTPPPDDTPQPGSPDDASSAISPSALATPPEGYELLQVLGQGGMGVVYKARQKNAGRLVALKLIRTERLTSESDMQRFRNEAEAAAQLDHPHIVSVYEVGARPGHFFFSMKLIEGGGLDEQLNRFRDDPHGAARLLALVARAVHHAHQRGILHRDLKPSNILLDREGQPHVSDFGLAKRIEADASLTQTGAIVGTPQYMAPEQTRGQKGAITTAVDVYGLGAVLYALLTGRPPFRGDTVLETLEQVREREPEPPRRINTKVGRDLETICLKCLHKEPHRRYESAQAVAEDLERWLGGEPIRARRASRWERLRRWVRRRPALAALVFVIGLALGGFIAGLLRYNDQLQRAAEREKAAADRERQKRQLARQAVDEMYLQVAEKWLADQVQLTEVQQGFLRKALQFYEQFAHEQGDEPEVRWDTARAYNRVARIQQKLGRANQAEQAYSQELALLDKLAADFPTDPRYRVQQAAVYNLLGQLRNVERFEGAEQAMRQGLDILERLVEEFPSHPTYRRDLAGSYGNLGFLLAWRFSRAQEAEKLLDKAVNLQTKLVAEFPKISTYPIDLAGSYRSLGILFGRQGRAVDSEKAFRRGLAQLKGTLPDAAKATTHRGLLANLLNNLGKILEQTGQIREAERAWREAMAIYRKLVAEFPTTLEYRKSLAIALNNTGWLLRNKPEEACPLFEQAFAQQRAAFLANPRGAFYGELLRNHAKNLADTLLQLGKYQRAAEVAAELSQSMPEDLAARARAASRFARCARLAEQDGKLAEPERKLLARRYRDRAKQTLGEALKRLANGSPDGLNALAWFLATCPVAELRDATAAVACARKAVSLSPKAGGNWNTLGLALYRAGEWKEAVTTLQKSMALRKGGDSNDWFFLAMARWQLGEKDEARKWYAKAVQWMDKNQPQDEELRRFRAEAAELLGVKETPKALFWHGLRTVPVR